jgi:Family of unknown function (DUF5985)
MINGFLLGVIATCSLIAAVSFFRFWRDTRDSLFLMFGMAFAIEAINRSMLVTGHGNEGRVSVYLVRFVAFSLIIAGIIAKNRSR